MNKVVRTVFLATMLGMALTACGVKGSPQYPLTPEQKEEAKKERKERGEWWIERLLP